MAKYRGKYNKCRTCTHAKEVMMVLVVVEESCPNKKLFNSGGYYSDKYVCQKCDDWSERK